MTFSNYCMMGRCRESRYSKKFKFLETQDGTFQEKPFNSLFNKCQSKQHVKQTNDGNKSQLQDIWTSEIIKANTSHAP